MNMNSTTAITLNDRFSMIKKPSMTNIARAPRSRSRSREPRQRQQQQRSRSGQRGGRGVDLRGSQRNRALLNMLERQHKMRMALKLKNKSILTTRGRIQGQIARTKARRATAIKRTMNARTLARNNLTTFVPLNDSPGRMARGRSRSRSRSRNRIQNTLSVQDRLGFPAGRRMRMRRGPQQQQGNGNGAAQRSRSRSRVRLNRNNFRNGNQVPFKRSNSVNARLGNGGPVNNVKRQQNQVRGRNRSQSRGNGGPGNNVKRQQQQVRGRSQSRGNGRRIVNQTRFNRPLQGRIIKRKTQLATVRRNAAGNVVRNAKNFKRGQAGAVRKIRGGQQQQGNARGRARNRGNNNQQGQQQRRGRSRTRRGNNNNRGGGKISKETLDKQLDDYMNKGAA